MAGGRGQSTEMVQREGREIRIKDGHRSQIKKGGDRDFLEITPALG